MKEQPAKAQCLAGNKIPMSVLNASAHGELGSASLAGMVGLARSKRLKSRTADHSLLSSLRNVVGNVQCTSYIEFTPVPSLSPVPFPASSTSGTDACSSGPRALGCSDAASRVARRSLLRLFTACGAGGGGDSETSLPSREAPLVGLRPFCERAVPASQGQQHPPLEASSRRRCRPNHPYLETLQRRDHSDNQLRPAQCCCTVSTRAFQYLAIQNLDNGWTALSARRLCNQTWCTPGFRNLHWNNGSVHLGVAKDAKL